MEINVKRDNPRNISEVWPVLSGYFIRIYRVYVNMYGGRMWTQETQWWANPHKSRRAMRWDEMTANQGEINRS